MTGFSHRTLRAVTVRIRTSRPHGRCGAEVRSTGASATQRANAVAVLDFRTGADPEDRLRPDRTSAAGRRDTALRSAVLAGRVHFGYMASGHAAPEPRPSPTPGAEAPLGGTPAPTGTARAEGDSISAPRGEIRATTREWRGCVRARACRCSADGSSAGVNSSSGDWTAASRGRPYAVVAARTSASSDEAYPRAPARAGRRPRRPAFRSPPPRRARPPAPAPDRCPPDRPRPPARCPAFRRRIRR